MLNKTAEQTEQYLDVRTLIRSQSLLFAHNSILFERRHDDLLKLQRYARTIEIDKQSKNKEEQGSTILIGIEDDPADERTLKRFIEISNRKTAEEL